MYTKTAAVFGFVAVSGVSAQTGYPASSHSYATKMNNATAPTPVWQYYNMTVPTTVVVHELTTVCPEKTTMTYNGVHYSATKGETITVTNCPCTVTTNVQVMTSSVCPPGATPTAVAPAVPSVHTYTAGTPGTVAEVTVVNTPSAPNTVVTGTHTAVATETMTDMSGYPMSTPVASVSVATVPAGAAPAAASSYMTTSMQMPQHTSMTMPASASATYSAMPTGVEISGAERSGKSLLAVMVAAFFGAVAL